MKIIREHDDNGVCVIRTKHYTSTLAYIQMLVAEARKDFPALKAEDIAVKCYAGKFYRHTFGIHFSPANTVPSTYQKIRELECTY